MDSEKVLAKGNCERIGQEGAFIGFKAPDGTKIERKTEMVNHTQAFEAVKDALLDPGSLQAVMNSDKVSPKQLSITS